MAALVVTQRQIELLDEALEAAFPGPGSLADVSAEEVDELRETLAAALATTRAVTEL